MPENDIDVCRGYARREAKVVVAGQSGIPSSAAGEAGSGNI